MTKLNWPYRLGKGDLWGLDGTGLRAHVWVNGALKVREDHVATLTLSFMSTQPPLGTVISCGYLHFAEEPVPNSYPP